MLLVVALAVLLGLATVFGVLRGRLPSEVSKRDSVRIGGVVGALIAAVPAIPFTFIMVVFSHGDEPRPLAASIVWSVLGAVVIAAGALCGMIIGASVAILKTKTHGE